MVLFFPTRGCGCIEHPAFPTPSLIWAKHSCITRALRAAGMRSHKLNVIASASEAIHLTEERKNGLLRRDRSSQRRWNDRTTLPNSHARWASLRSEIVRRFGTCRLQIVTARSQCDEAIHRSCLPCGYIDCFADARKDDWRDFTLFGLNQCLITRRTGAIVTRNN